MLQIDQPFADHRFAAAESPGRGAHRAFLDGSDKRGKALQFHIVRHDRKPVPATGDYWRLCTGAKLVSTRFLAKHLSTVGPGDPPCETHLYWPAWPSC